jgi:hypothetical protein
MMSVQIVADTIELRVYLVLVEYAAFLFLFDRFDQKILHDVEQALGADVGGRKLERVVIDHQVNQSNHFTKA